jgi:hypothetical protein
MTDQTSPLSPPSAAPAPAPSVAPGPAAPTPATATDILAAPLTPEAARLQIDTLKGDKEFYARLNSDKPEIKAAALEAWRKLHIAAYPPPPQVTLENVKDIHGNQEVMRRSERMESGLAVLRAMGVTDPASLDEVRKQVPVAAAEQQFAREEIARLKSDRAWVRRYLDGDREARAIFTRLHQVISLPTARTPTTYPVK